MAHEKTFKRFFDKLRKRGEQMIEEASQESVFSTREEAVNRFLIQRRHELREAEAVAPERKPKGQKDAGKTVRGGWANDVNLDDTSLNSDQIDGLVNGAPEVDYSQNYNLTNYAPDAGGGTQVEIGNYASGDPKIDIKTTVPSGGALESSYKTRSQWIADILSGKNKVSPQIFRAAAALKSAEDQFKGERGDSAQIRRDQWAQQVGQLQAQAGQSEGGGTSEQPPTAQGGQAATAPQAAPVRRDPQQFTPADFLSGPDTKELAKRDNEKRNLNNAATQLANDLDGLIQRGRLSKGEREELMDLAATFRDSIESATPEQLKEIQKKYLPILQAFRKINRQREDDELQAQLAPEESKQRGSDNLDTKDPEFPPLELGTEPGGKLASLPDGSKVSDIVGTNRVRGITSIPPVPPKAPEKIKDPKVPDETKDPTKPKALPKEDGKVKTLTKAARASRKRKESSSGSSSTKSSSADTFSPRVSGSAKAKTTNLSKRKIQQIRREMREIAKKMKEANLSENELKALSKKMDRLQGELERLMRSKETREFTES